MLILLLLSKKCWSYFRFHPANEIKQFKETKNIIYTWLDQAFYGTLGNRALSSLHGRSLENTLKVPLKQHFITLRSTFLKNLSTDQTALYEIIYGKLACCFMTLSYYDHFSPIYSLLACILPSSSLPPPPSFSHCTPPPRFALFPPLVIIIE